MDASEQGNRERDGTSSDFYEETDETSLALEMFDYCKNGHTHKKFHSKAVRYYEIPLRVLENTEFAQELAMLGDMNLQTVRVCSLKIVDLLLFNTKNDPFLSLGLSRNADEDEIHRRWKRLLVLFHPDRSSPGMLNMTRTKTINAAYQSIRKLLLERTSTNPDVHLENYWIREKSYPIGAEIISPVNQALDNALKICVKYFWRALYAINVLAGSVKSRKRLRRIKNDADYLMFIPSIIVLLTAVVALVMFSLYIVHFLFSLVGRIGFG